MADAVRRMLRALVRRASDGDLFALGELGTLVDDAREAVGDAALGAHDGPAGYSWTDIGLELEITRQAAWQLYGRPGDDSGQ